MERDFLFTKGLVELSGLTSSRPAFATVSAGELHAIENDRCVSIEQKAYREQKYLGGYGPEVIGHGSPWSLRDQLMSIWFAKGTITMRNRT